MNSRRGHTDCSFDLTVYNVNPEIKTNTIPSDMSINEGIDISYVIDLSFTTTDISSDYTWTIIMKEGDTIINNTATSGWLNDLSISILDVSRARITGKTPGWDMSGVYTMFVDVSDGHGGHTDLFV